MRSFFIPLTLGVYLIQLFPRSGANRMSRTKFKRTRSRNLWRPIIFIIVLLLLIWVGRIVVGWVRVQNDLRALRNSELATVLTSTPDVSTNLEHLVTQSLQDIQELRAALGPVLYLLPRLGWLPHYGGDLQNAPALLDLSESILRGAQDTLTIGYAIGAEIEAGRATKTSLGTALLIAAESQQSTIQRAQKTLSDVAHVRTQVNATQVSADTQALLDQVDRLVPMWQTAINVLANARTILGAERPRTYLLLAQNSDELRATGGFISGVGLVQIEQGKISVLDFQDSFAIDDFSQRHPAPPEPLRRYMFAGQWVLRDANWSPDFPTAARQLQAIYKIDRRREVDGVIAINQQILPDLLAAMGTVTVETYNERVDATNVIAKIHEYWALPQSPGQPSDWWSHRKDFLGKLMQAILQRMTLGNLDQSKLGRVVLNAIQTKNLLLYVNDVESLSQPGLPLGGAVDPSSGDWLMVVDSNVGFNKVDGSVSRQVAYNLTIESTNSLRASVTITYTNLSPRVESYCVHLPNYQFTYVDLQQGCYWNYLRVLVPAGSELLQSMGVADVTVEPGDKAYTVFAGYFVLPHAETHVVRFNYRLPPSVQAMPHYRLTLQRQPGAPIMPLQVQIHAPAGLQLITYPRADRVLENTAQFELIWRGDEQIQVTLAQPAPADILAIVIGAGLVVIVGIGLLIRWRREQLG